MARFGGRYLVRGALAEVIEADWPFTEPPPQTVIVAEFPSMKALKDWYSSQYAEAFAFRAAAVKRRMIFVAGIDDAAESTRDRSIAVSIVASRPTPRSAGLVPR